MKSSLLASLLALAFAGCASVGNEMNMTQTAQIQKGATTRAEMEKLFGKPMSVTTLGNGTSMAMWMYSQAKSTARNFIPVVNIVSTKVETKNQLLQVTFDAEGKVVDYTFTEGGAPIKAGII